MIKDKYGVQSTIECKQNGNINCVVIDSHSGDAED